MLAPGAFGHSSPAGRPEVKLLAAWVGGGRWPTQGCPRLSSLLCPWSLRRSTIIVTCRILMVSQLCTARGGA